MTSLQPCSQHRTRPQAALDAAQRARQAQAGQGQADASGADDWLSSAHVSARDAIIADLTTQLECLQREREGMVTREALEAAQAQARQLEQALLAQTRERESGAAALCVAEARAAEAERRAGTQPALRERIAQLQEDLDRERREQREAGRQLAACQASLAETRGGLQRKEVCGFAAESRAGDRVWRRVHRRARGVPAHRAG